MFFYPYWTNNYKSGHEDSKRQFQFLEVEHLYNQPLLSFRTFAGQSIRRINSMLSSIGLLN